MSRFLLEIYSILSCQLTDLLMLTSLFNVILMTVVILINSLKVRRCLVHLWFLLYLITRWLHLQLKIRVSDVRFTIILVCCPLYSLGWPNVFVWRVFLEGSQWFFSSQDRRVRSSFNRQVWIILWAVCVHLWLVYCKHQIASSTHKLLIFYSPHFDANTLILWKRLWNIFISPMSYEWSGISH